MLWSVVLAVVVAVGLLVPRLLPERKRTVVHIGESNCVELFADGTTTKLAKFHVPCHDEVLGAHVPDLTELRCADGRELIWSDQGWGYVDETWHRRKPGAEPVAPAAEVAAFKGTG